MCQGRGWHLSNRIWRKLSLLAADSVAVTFRTSCALFCNTWCEPGTEAGAQHRKGPAASHTLNLSAPPASLWPCKTILALQNVSAPGEFLYEHIVPQRPTLAYTTAWLFPQRGYPSFWDFWGTQDTVKWEPEEYSDLVNTSCVPRPLP